VNRSEEEENSHAQLRARTLNASLKVASVGGTFVDATARVKYASV
jgi:hypothetical protein